MKLGTKRNSINEASSFDKVLSRLEKITERVNETSDGIVLEEARDAAVEKRGDSDYRDKLEALVRKVVTSPGRSKSAVAAPRPKTTRVKGTDFEVELVLSMSQQLDDSNAIISPSRRAANDIIWRAYATTKSFGAIIAGVVATQAVARRWLTLRRVREEMNRRIGGVSRIKAVWRGYCCRRRFRKDVNGERDLFTCRWFPCAELDLT